MDILSAYKKLNRSFSKRYIFNFGSEGGFYSEFNNMVFGMTYCLKYGYQFVMYSGNSKFKINKGWEDFFEPFFDTENSLFHKKFNKRVSAPRIKLKHYPRWLLFRLSNKNSFLTYELFNLFYNAEFEKELFDFSQLNLKGNLREVSREIVKMVYRFNKETQTEIDAVISALKLPKRYASVNVRWGDKDTEFKLVPLEDYVDQLKQVTDCSDVFVFTDDYSVVEELRELCPGTEFYTLVEPKESGYVHADFIRQEKLQRKKALIKMFASIEIMRASEIAIGAYTNNPGLFLGMSMPEDRFISIQKSSWYQFEKADVMELIAQ